jgi:hypothetical protein
MGIVTKSDGTDGMVRRTFLVGRRRKSSKEKEGAGFVLRAAG